MKESSESERESRKKRYTTTGGKAHPLSLLSFSLLSFSLSSPLKKRRYLGILKGVHSGADLSAAAAAVGDGLPGAARPHIGALLFSQSQNNSGNGAGGNALATIQHAVAARAAIAPSLPGNRDLLYLDLALEDTARRAAEAAAGAARGGRAAAALVGPLLANLALSLGDNKDVCMALKAWEDAPKAATSGFVGGGGSPQPLSEDAALRAAAAADRARRAVARAADAVQARIGDKADALGGTLGVEPWARDLFVEEVVRGGPAFGASLALSAAEPALRAAASLEPWQVVSPGSAVGILRLAASLHELAYDDLSAAEEGGAPVVLLVARVSGEEEPPTGAAAVLTGVRGVVPSFFLLPLEFPPPAPPPPPLTLDLSFLL